MDDASLKMDVVEALKQMPLIDASAIAVIADDGVITLIGKVRSPTQRMMIEFAIPALSGVRALNHAIEVGDEDVPHHVTGEFGCDKRRMAGSALRGDGRVDVDGTPARIDIEFFEWVESGAIAIRRLFARWLNRLRFLLSPRKAIQFKELAGRQQRGLQAGQIVRVAGVPSVAWATITRSRPLR